MHGYVRISVRMILDKLSLKSNACHNGVYSASSKGTRKTQAPVLSSSYWIHTLFGMVNRFVKIIHANHCFNFSEQNSIAVKCLDRYYMLLISFNKVYEQVYIQTTVLSHLPSSLEAIFGHNLRQNFITRCFAQVQPHHMTCLDLHCHIYAR